MGRVKHDEIREERELLKEEETGELTEIPIEHDGPVASESAEWEWVHQIMELVADAERSGSAPHFECLLGERRLKCVGKGMRCLKCMR